MSVAKVVKFHSVDVNLRRPGGEVLPVRVYRKEVVEGDEVDVAPAEINRELLKASPAQVAVAASRHQIDLDFPDGSDAAIIMSAPGVVSRAGPVGEYLEQTLEVSAVDDLFIEAMRVVT